ncbi:MAG: diacylglycerol kinase, partial [Microbacteriaceae bacterium]|nr:diacylglycerol kinase [Burkholderiaceae bacterium]
MNEFKPVAGRPPSPMSITGPLFIVFNLGSGAGDGDSARAAIQQACDAAGRSFR